MNLYCFDHVGGTGWIVAAGVRQYRADDPLVDLYGNDEQKTKKLSDETHAAKLRNLTCAVVKTQKAAAFM